MIDLSKLMGGSGGTASAASAALSATPYGAALGAAGGLLSGAMTDTPMSATSGAGSYQSGPFTVGAKIVGKGNSAGATTATASQTPGDNSTASPGTSLTSTQASQTTLYVIIAAAVLLLLGGMFATRRR